MFHFSFFFHFSSTVAYPRMAIDRSFYRKLLRTYWNVRHMPYHIQETLFLLSLYDFQKKSLSESDHTALLGVDRHCNPVERSCNAAIDAEAVFRRGYDEIRRSVRKVVTADPGVPQGLLEYKKLVQQGKLFWLLRRLTNMKEKPHRVPSAGAGGVRTSVLLDRPGTDTFTMSDLFLNCESDKEKFTIDRVPSSCVVETPRVSITIQAEHYEPTFTPAADIAELLQADEASYRGADPLQATTNRFLVTVTLTPKNALFHSVVVNSLLFCLDVQAQVLSEEVGTFVNVARIPLLAKSEDTRQQRGVELPNGGDIVASGSGEGSSSWFLRSSAMQRAGNAPRKQSGSDGGRVEDAPPPSERYSTTLQLVSEGGPAIVKGVLYLKEMVEDVTVDDQLVPVLAQTAIETVQFGPIALRCTL